MQTIFITGIGTGVGKTLVSAIVTEALGAAYWKPVQAGFDDGTDAGSVGQLITSPEGRLIPETYKLALPASPHIAARQENIRISLDRIAEQFDILRADGGPVGTARYLVVEGAGGLYVPLNEKEFMLDLAQQLDATVLLVSRNYLGSINHSLLTAEVCRARRLKVAGWIFNDQYGDYEQEIAAWTGLPSIASIPFTDDPDKAFVQAQAAIVRPALLHALGLPG